MLEDDRDLTSSVPQKLSGDNTSTDILKDGLPLPYALGTETYNTVGIQIENSKDSQYAFTDSSTFLAMKPSFLERVRGGKPVLIKRNDGKLYIPKPNTVGMLDDEMKALWEYERVDGIRRPKTYKDHTGKEILDADSGKPIPIPKRFDIDFSLSKSNKERDQKRLEAILKTYLDNPEMLSSYDGHAGIKHDYDSILALRLLESKSVFGESFCKIEATPRMDNDGQQIPYKHNFVLTTEGVVTIPGDILPDRLIHTQVSKEIADGIRGRLNNAKTPQERRVIVDNFKTWVNHFCGGNDVMGIMMYCEVMYMLKFDYNKSYEQGREFTSSDIDSMFTKEGLRDVVGGSTEHKELGNRIHGIFSTERVDKSSYTEKFLAFESKIDDSLEIIENSLPLENLDSLRMVGGFNRRVRPRIVFGAVSSGDDVLPTSSLTTSYLKEYDNTYITKGISNVLVGKKKDSIILDNARRSREEFDSILELGGRESVMDRNLYVRGVRVLDRDSTLVKEVKNRLEDTLGMGSDELEKFHMLVMKNR